MLSDMRLSMNRNMFCTETIRWELQKLGVSVVDNQKARFAFILLNNTVKVPTARHIITEAGSPSRARRALDSHYTSSKTGAKMIVMVEFTDLRYTRGK